jgi:membrane protein required for beta-lactamase induction
VDVDQVLDAQAGVDERLDLFDAEAVHVAADAIAVVGHLVDHLAAWSG